MVMVTGVVPQGEFTVSLSVCLQGSDETIRVVSMDRDYHVDCYHCKVRHTEDLLFVATQS